jgi:serine protease Do
MINRYFMTFPVLLFVFYMPLCAVAQEDARVVPTQISQVQLSYAPLVKKVAPAVVNVYTKRAVRAGIRSPFMDDPFFGMFFDRNLFGGQMRPYLENALGSGVIVSEGGLVVTNAHVIKGADEVSVGLSDGKEYSADVLLADEASDLALLRIKTDEKAQSFPYVTLRPSVSLEVGDLVLAIGNPFGVGQTVTSGIVSAKGRSSLDINDYNFFIQTDAAINPGNSGGPLVAMDGRVVGINTAIFSRSGGSMGLGFSIPSEMVASVIAAEMNGQVSDRGIIRPWLGVQAQDITSDIAESLGLKNSEGALVSDLHTASPFGKAGLKVGDVVLRANNHPIRSAAELKFIMATVPLGRDASVDIWHNGKVKNLKVKAVAPPNIPPREETELKGNHILRGAVVANLNPAVSVELGLPVDDSEGVVVMNAPVGFFSRTLIPGDLLVSINGMKITSPREVDEALSQPISSGYELMVERQGSMMRLILR